MQMSPVSEESPLLPGVDLASGWNCYDPEKLEVDANTGTNEPLPAVVQDDGMAVMDTWHEQTGLLAYCLVTVVAYHLLRLTVQPKSFGDRLGGERWACLIPQLILTIFYSNSVVIPNTFCRCGAPRGEASSEIYAVKLRNSLQLKIFWASQLVCALSSSTFFALDIMTVFTESRALRDLLRYLAVTAVFFGGTACVFAYLCREFILNWPFYDKSYNERLKLKRKERAVTVTPEGMEYWHIYPRIIIVCLARSLASHQMWRMFTTIEISGNGQSSPWDLVRLLLPIGTDHIVLFDCWRLWRIVHGLPGLPIHTVKMKMRRSISYQLFWISELLWALSCTVIIWLKIAALTHSRALMLQLNCVTYTIFLFGGATCLFAYLSREFIVTWPCYVEKATV